MDDKPKMVKLVALTRISRPADAEPIPTGEDGLPVRSIFIEPGEEFMSPSENAQILIELNFAKPAEKAKPTPKAESHPESPAAPGGE